MVNPVISDRPQPERLRLIPPGPNRLTYPTLRVSRVDASDRVDGSIICQLADRIIGGLKEHAPDLTVTRRDVAQSLPFVDAAWVSANLAEPDARSTDQRQALAGSDALAAAVMEVEVWVIATPIYNFGVPSSLKAWIDQIARARLTFRYTDQGPKDLLAGKKVYILPATGDTGVGSAIHFAAPWLKFVLGVLGITDIELIAADRSMMRGDSARQSAADRIDQVRVRDGSALATA